jgi:hypothetical protein
VRGALAGIILDRAFNSVSSTEESMIYHKLRPIALLIAISGGALLSAGAQQKGQYLPGQFGLNSGILPEAGITYSSMTINYSADRLNDSQGDQTPLTGIYSVWAVENLFFYVPNKKILGGKLMTGIVAPTFANGSVTVTQLGANAGGFGIADILVQPVTLGWKLKRADLWIGDGFVAPTGRYTPGASDNIGSGYWGNQVMSGSTVYLTKNKGTSANLFTDWETHGTKEGSNITPGQTFTMEWAFGQVLPLDKQMHKLFQAGLIGYDQWQVSNDSGNLSSGIPASTVPYYSANAIGFQTNFILPQKNLNLFFKFDEDFSAKARVEGRTFVFGGNYTFRIPRAERHS